MTLCTSGKSHRTIEISLFFGGMIKVLESTSTPMVIIVITLKMLSRNVPNVVEVRLWKVGNENSCSHNSVYLCERAPFEPVYGGENAVSLQLYVTYTLKNQKPFSVTTIMTTEEWDQILNIG
jgi:hypothetical protein